MQVGCAESFEVALRHYNHLGVIDRIPEIIALDFAHALFVSDGPEMSRRTRRLPLKKSPADGLMLTVMLL